MKRIFALTLYCLFLQGCSSVFYYPDNYLRATPKSFNHEYTEYFIMSGKHELGVWHIPHKNKESKPVATVVQFHGNAENMSSHFYSLLWMVEKNVELLTFDYRGYGTSDGEPSQLGLREDGIAALEEAYKRHKDSGSGKFVVYAQSLGGAVALDAIINWEHSSEIDLLALDSTFAEYSEVAALKLKSNWFTWIFHPLAYIMISDETSSAKHLKKIKNITTLIVHGDKDGIVPIENGKRVYEELAGKKYWWKLKGGKHLQNFHGQYTPKRKEFMELLKAL